MYKESTRHNSLVDSFLFLLYNYIMNKKMFKKTGTELQEYLQIMRRHNVVPAKKGKGTYTRKQKHIHTCPLP